MDSRCVQSGAANARCKLGQSRATTTSLRSLRLDALLNKQRVDLFHTDGVTRI